MKKLSPGYFVAWALMSIFIFGTGLIVMFFALIIALPFLLICNLLGKDDTYGEQTNEEQLNEQLGSLPQNTAFQSYRPTGSRPKEQAGQAT